MNVACWVGGGGGRRLHSALKWPGNMHHPHTPRSCLLHSLPGHSCLKGRFRSSHIGSVERSQNQDLVKSVFPTTSSLHTGTTTRLQVQLSAVSLFFLERQERGPETATASKEHLLVSSRHTSGYNGVRWCASAQLFRRGGVPCGPLPVVNLRERVCLSLPLPIFWTLVFKRNR
jgi:hypothetical protein